MTVELSIVIAALSFAFAVYTGIINLRRAGRSEIKKDSAELVTVIVKLENIEKILDITVIGYLHNFRIEMRYC